MSGLPFLLILTHQGVVGLLGFMDPKLLSGESARNAIIAETSACKRGVCGRKKSLFGLVMAAEVSTEMYLLQRKYFKRGTSDGCLG